MSAILLVLQVLCSWSMLLLPVGYTQCRHSDEDTCKCRFIITMKLSDPPSTPQSPETTPPSPRNKNKTNKKTSGKEHSLAAMQKTSSLSACRSLCSRGGPKRRLMMAAKPFFSTVTWILSWKYWDDSAAEATTSFFAACMHRVYQQAVHVLCRLLLVCSNEKGMILAGLCTLAEDVSSLSIQLVIRV